MLVKARLRGSICVNPIYLYYILFAKKVRVFFLQLFFCGGGGNKGNFVYKRAAFIISERSRGTGPRATEKNAAPRSQKNARIHEQKTHALP